MIGKTLGHYKVGEQLGRGGMGEVYVADDLNLNRKVALKFLPEAFTGDPERMARFEREAKLLASLNHPNIAAIHGLEQAEGKRFLVLELVEGETLAQRLSKGPLPVEEALGVCRQIAEGLEAAHEKGVIHRDLKPANVMITEGDKVKILDFGLAKALSDETQSVDSSKSPTLTEAMTRPGVILGTAAYMSPEQAKGKALDKRADIWAFGCILYECLTARRPFHGDTVTETLASILKGEPDWGALPAGTSWNLAVLLRRCLQKDPKERLHDIADARIEIEAILSSPLLEGLGGGNLPVKRHALLRAVAWALPCVLVGAIGAIVFMGPRKESTAPRLHKYRLAVGTSDQAALFLTGAAISPDGRRVTYGLRDGIWVQDLDKLEPRRIYDTEGAAQPFWSPDSAHVGFFDIVKHTLERIPAAGGEARTICQIPGSDIGGASWVTEGSIIFCWGAGWSARGGGGLFEVPDGGGNPSVLAEAGEREIGFTSPLVLPKGAGLLVILTYADRTRKVVRILKGGLREPVFDIPGSAPTSTRIAYSPTGHILYGMGTGVAGGLWAVPLSLSPLGITGKPVRVSEEASGPSVSADGSLVYIPKLLAAQRLIWVNRRGEVTGTIGQSQEFISDPSVSPDGGRVAVRGTEAGKSDIWIHDVARGTKTRLTSEAGSNIQPVWKSEGREVVYSSMADVGRVVARPVDGSGRARPLIDAPVDQYEPDISKDSRFLVFIALEPSRGIVRDLWYVPLMNGGKPTSFLEGPFDVLAPKLSIDSRYVAYVSNEGEQYDVYVQPFPQRGDKVKISTNGGREPKWGPGGHTLYFVQGNSLMEVRVNTDSRFQAGPAKELFRGDAIGIQLLSQTTPYLRVYGVAPDEQHFVLVQSILSRQAGLVLVENWASQLGR